MGFGYFGNRLSTLTIGRGTYDYAYEGTSGNLETVTAPEGASTTFGYDGSLVTSETTTGTISGSIGWTYDNDFRLHTETLAGNTTTYGYDPDSLLTTAGPLTITRDPGNGLPSGTTAGIIDETIGWNGYAEPHTDQYTAKGSPAFGESFTRDDGGRITQIDESRYGLTFTRNFDYDTAGRLWKAYTNGQLDAEYQYDDNGNRKAKTTTSGTITYTVDDQDRLISSSDGTTYTYAPNGELATKTDTTGTTSYSYDELGNLLKVTKADGTVIEYVIDGLNRRVGKKVNGTLLQGWLWRNQLQIAAQTDGTGTITKRFVYATRANVPDLMIAGGTTYRLVVDHLGSVRYVLDTTTGTITDSVDYDEFGNVRSDSNPGFQPFGFAGGLYDRDTGLVRFGARDYDPHTGRWTSKDPLLFWGNSRSFYDWTANIYQYCDGDPVNFFDPSGLEMDSVSRSMQEAIARGDADEIAQILDEAGETLPDKLRAAAQKALQRFRSKAKDVISKECKGSINREFPEQLREKSLSQIWKEAREGNKAAQTAKKLLSDSRLRK
ncbi:MAG: RHS repeat-associated core domain-containing protein [Thermoanaerobaculia bacterium]